MTTNNNFLKEIANTDIFQKIETHVKTPLHQEVLHQQLKKETWEKQTTTFYEKNIELYTDIFLTNEENRNLINDQIKIYEETQKQIHRITTNKEHSEWHLKTLGEDEEYH